MKTYPVSAISSLIQNATEQGYDFIQVEEGTLGHGHFFLMAPRPDWYSFEVTERCLNEWSSGHTVRRFSNVSTRIKKLLENTVC